MERENKLGDSPRSNVSVPVVIDSDSHSSSSWDIICSSNEASSSSSINSLSRNLSDFELDSTSGSEDFTDSPKIGYPDSVNSLLGHLDDCDLNSRSSSEISIEFESELSNEDQSSASGKLPENTDSNYKGRPLFTSEKWCDWIHSSDTGRTSFPSHMLLSSEVADRLALKTTYW